MGSNGTIIQAFKALEEIDDDVVVVKVKEKKQLKENLNESSEDYYVLSDGANPKNSVVYAKIDNLDDFVATLEQDDTKGNKYFELLHYVKGSPKKVWDSKDGKVQESCKVKEDYNDLEANYGDICQEIVDKVKELTGKEIDCDDVVFDDSRAWSLYINGALLNLPVRKFGAYRNYNGGGVRGPLSHNGREQDGKEYAELGQFFADKLSQIEDLINAGSEDEEEWDKPTGVLENKEEEETKEETLVENTTVNLNNKEEVAKAKEEIENDTPDEEVEQIIDVDADTVDKLKDSYVGQVVIICNKCRKPRYISPEDLNKDEETGLYNKGEACTNCGSDEGFELVGQIGKYDSQDEEHPEEKPEETPAEETPTEEPKKEEPKVSPIEDNDNISAVEDFDNTKFDTLVTKYLKEVYENVDSFETKDGSIEDNKIVLEGTIKYFTDKTKDAKFVFENISKTKGNKFKLVGMNEALTTEKDAFSVIATINNKVLTCETFTYNYKTKVNEEETLIRGRTSLRESKKQKESK